MLCPPNFEVHIHMISSSQYICGASILLNVGRCSGQECCSVTVTINDRKLRCIHQINVGP